MFDKFGNFGIPSEYSKHIGLVTVSWSYLERFVEWLIWSLADMTNEPAICVSITNHLTFKTKYDMALSLAEIYQKNNDNDKYNEIVKILKLANNLRVERNNICHTPWDYKDDKMQCINFTARTKIKIVPISFDLQKTEQLIIDIQDCSDKLMSIVGEIITENVEQRKSLLGKVLEQLQNKDRDQDHTDLSNQSPPESSQE
jgi:hypothetical protein